MNAVPLGLERGVSALTFATAVFLVVVHTLMVAMASPRAGLSPRARLVTPFWVGAFLAVWLGVVLVVSDPANYPIAHEEALRRPLSALVGFGPLAAVVIALYRNRTIRAINDATPAEWLIRAQTYRVLGLTFLFPLFFYGVVPAGFAFPAAIGDFLTGLCAPWVAAAVAQGRPGARERARAWNLFGIADLVVATTTAVVFNAPMLTLHPTDLVPLFMGPPLGIATHLYSLRTLSRTTRGIPERLAPVAEPARAA